MNNGYPSFTKDKFDFWILSQRQTLPDAMPQNFSDHIKNFFQMDMNDKDSWFSRIPQITHRDRPTISSPKDVAPCTKKNKFPESAKAGMYTKSQHSEFWYNILMSSTSQIALQKFTGKLIIPSCSKKRTDEFTYNSDSILLVDEADKLCIKRTKFSTLKDFPLVTYYHHYNTTSTNPTTHVLQSSFRGSILIISCGAVFVK